MPRPPKDQIICHPNIDRYSRLDDVASPLTSTARIYAGPGIGLAEIQATVEPPSRSRGRILAIGVPRSEVEQVLSAVLIPTLLGRPDYDVRCRLVGAEKYQPAFGLAVVTAIISSYLKKPIPEHYAFLGEIDLHNKVRGGSGRIIENLRRSIDCDEVSSSLSLVLPAPLRASVLAALGVELIPCSTLIDVIAATWVNNSV